jgi:hypothetical protein
MLSLPLLLQLPLHYHTLLLPLLIATATAADSKLC